MADAKSEGRAVQTILPDPRLPQILQREAQDGHDAATRALVGQWWELAEIGGAVEEEVRTLERRLAMTRERHLRILGGRETVEAMILKQIGPRQAAAPDAVAGNNGGDPGGAGHEGR